MFTPQQITVFLLATTAILYTGALAGYWWSSRPGMAIAFLGYVIGNIGFIVDVYTRQP